MSLKHKIIRAITSQPKMVTFGIVLAITFVVGTVMGMVDHNQMSIDAFARSKQIISQ